MATHRLQRSVIIAGVAAALFGAGAVTSPVALAADDPAQEARVIDLVNQERAAAGCAAVAADERLAAAADAHSGDMSERGYFAHSSPEGDTFVERADRAGHPSPGAENIARGQTSAERVMEGWMNSPGHRENILDCSLKTLGVGVETDGWYWTQVFGR